MTTPFQAASKKFPPGTRVEIQAHYLLRIITEHGQIWREDIDGDYIAVRVIRYRDSDDDPLVCVVKPSLAGVVSYWCPPDVLMVKR